MIFNRNWPTTLFVIFAATFASTVIYGHQNEMINSDPSGMLNETELIDDMQGNSRCQPMTIPFCENVGYNTTMLPNLLNHQTQADVIREINIYHPLLGSECSPDLRLFLCTVHAPFCSDNAEESNSIKLGPCRSLCESVRRGCSSHFRPFNIGWPQAFRCEQFPERTRKGISCVGRYDETKLTSSTFSDGQDATSNSIIRDLGFVCPKNFEVPTYTLHLNGKNYSNCARPCEDVILDIESANIVRISTAIIALVCFISTLITCLAYLADTKRFKYPSKPVIIMAMCQSVVATCYLIGFLTDNKIACNDPLEPPKSLPNLNMIRATTMGNKKGSCTLQFMALYFFQVSTMLWWLVMTISWFMIARLRWAPEAVSGMARYFHFGSWTIPALLTIYLSVLGNIEGDSITGTCYVNFSDLDSIQAFVMYPTLICVGSGCMFLFLGLKSLWDSRETLRREYGKQTDEHYKLIFRLGIFSAFFILFSSVLIICHYYEQSNLNNWMLAWLSRICKSRDYSMPCPMRNVSHQKPNHLIFITKYTATMGIGVISALFTLSERTLTAFSDIAELCKF